VQHAENTSEVDGQEMAVEQPAGAMDQEAAMAAALTAVSTVEVTPSSRSLLDDAGHLVLTALRA
jgi:heat shock protein HslJ